MEQHKNKFLVVTFVDSSTPSEQFVETVPWKWVKDGFVFYPKEWKCARQKSNVDSVPDYKNSASWEKCKLIGVKGKFFILDWLVIKLIL